MELVKVNHVITQTKAMLDTLLQGPIITGEEAHDLLIVLVLHAIRNDNIDIEMD